MATIPFCLHCPTYHFIDDCPERSAEAPVWRIPGRHLAVWAVLAAAAWAPILAAAWLVLR